jgi:PKD repeat protein
MKLFVFSFAVVFSLRAYGQAPFSLNWPKPASTPNTTVVCDAASYPGCQNAPGKNIAGWDLPIKSYVGRIIDSGNVSPVQFGFRSARGYLFRVTPTRILENTGSAVLSWNRATFFDRARSETLVAGTTYPAERRSFPEWILKWDSSFCAQCGANGWDTPNTDGDQRLYDIDTDDRGFVYVAHVVFGWGITKDGLTGKFDAGLQKKPIDDATHIFSLKGSDGRYYAGVSNPSPLEIWAAGNSAGLPSSLTKVATHNIVVGGWAKTADEKRIAIITAGQVRIYDVDTLIAGGNALLTAGQPDCGGLPCGAITAVTSDGTNFFARYDKLATRSGLMIFRASGSTYTQTNVDLGIKPDAGANGSLRYGAGLLVWTGSEVVPGWVSTVNIHIYRLNDLTPVEIKSKDGSLFRFWGQYYGGADGFAAWNSVLYDAVPVDQGGKTYLLVAAFGLADVFELQTSDSITASVVSKRQTANPNSANISGDGPYVGDQITFRSETSTGLLPQVTWDFGDGRVGSTPAAAADRNITHQFSSAGTFNVTATNGSDTTQKGTVSLPVKTPAIGIGVLGRPELLFTAPNASSTAPVITSDAFTDASDGGVESHYVDWMFTGGTTSQLAPSSTMSVGGCGAHTLVFAAHYGPYTLGSLPPASTSGGLSINALTYAAKPYVAAISGPTAGAAGKVRFTASPRLTALPADLPQGTATPVTYLWTANNGETATGTATLGTVPFFDVTKPSTSVSVTLTLTVTGTLPAACAPFAASSTSIGPLAAPVATLQKTGCTIVGANCSFTVVPTGSTAGWTYAWNVTPSVGMTVVGNTATLASSSMSPNVQYTVTVTVDNTIGVLPLSGTALVTAPSCPTMTASNVGASSSCGFAGSPCAVGSNITFGVTQFGYSFGCAPHTLTWNFGDGSANVIIQGTDSTTHVYSGAGQYTATVTIDNGSQQFPATVISYVGTGVIQPPPPPPPNPTPVPPTPTACGDMTGLNVYVSYGGTSAACNSAGTCSTGEAVTFSMTQFGYGFGCTTHTFAYNFGDGTPEFSTNATSGISHTYATAGTYTVTVYVTNDHQTRFPVQTSVRVTSPTPVNNCGTMSDSNVFVSFSGGKTACTNTNNNCQSSEDIDFSTTAGGGFLPGTTAYHFDCATHNLTWNFGEPSSGANNTATSTDPNAHFKHAYSSPGDYTVTLTINNGKQTFTASQPVHVTASNQGGLPAPCAPTQICVNKGTNARYGVTLSAKNPTPGKPAIAGTAVGQSGQFGFFSFPELTGDATNPEVMVKVMDGPSGKPWVFYAGLTNLDYTISVQDRQGSFTKSYHVAPPAGGSLLSIGDYDVDGATSPSCLPTETRLSVAAPSSCATTSSQLCLLDRFKVTLTATDRARSGQSGPGQALASSKAFGMFSTPFISDNTDIQGFIKMVDARPVDGHFWVFLGGLTDMELTYTVTDTLTGAQNIYTKPVSSTCGWNDTNAFR